MFTIYGSYTDFDESLCYSNNNITLLITCRQPKAKNRPSFRQIMMHLDLAAGAFLAIPPETYLMSQVRLSLARLVYPALLMFCAQHSILNGRGGGTGLCSWSD